MRLAWLTIAGLTCLAPRSAHAQPAVKLSDWEQSGNGTGVRFVALPALTEAHSADAAMRDQTSGGVFQYDVASGEVRWADECRCFRYYIVTVKSPVNGAITRHKFKAIPSGSFPDQYAQIEMTITEGERSDSDTIALPVGSAPGLQPAAIDVELTRPLQSVLLSGPSEFHLTLSNTGGMPVVVESVTLTPEQADLWVEPPSAGGVSQPLSLEPQRKAALKVLVKPRTTKAIGVSWPPTDNEQRHTTVAIDVRYENPLLQNRPGQAAVSVPVRFQPNVVALAAALALGVLLGSLVLLSRRKVSIWKPWLRAVTTALLVGVILELVAMFLVAKDSKFVLFGFNLDPWQSLPVVLLGTGVGLLGVKSADRLNKVFKG